MLTPPSIEDTSEVKLAPNRRLNILVLYDDWTAKTAAVKDQLLAFKEHSRHEVSYCIASRGDDPRAASLLRALHLASGFDVIVVHHSVRLTNRDYISPCWAGALASFKGFKVLFLQDEYEGTEQTRTWMERIGFHLLHTCVPEPYWDQVYPRARFPGLVIKRVLTGYVPSWAERRGDWKPVKDRSRLIGYRCHELPFWYGDLAREKLVIGQRIKSLCENRGLPVDIEWETGKQIYGTGWFDFVEDCRCTLGTESGSNLFDEHGDVQRAVEQALRADPLMTYEAVHEKFLTEKDGKIRMNQVSPRVFEAIALGSVLILFEGEYSGVIQPGVHFIPLRKDFSNIDEVLAKVDDLRLLEQIARRAYEDVIASGSYGYRQFIRALDGELEARVLPSEHEKIFFLSAGSRKECPPALSGVTRQIFVTSEPFCSLEDSMAYCDAMGGIESIAPLKARITGLSEKNRSQKQMIDAFVRVQKITGALAGSRLVAALRLLGIVSSPPQIKRSDGPSAVAKIEEYIFRSRWLRMIANWNSRLKSALKRD